MSNNVKSICRNLEQILEDLNFSPSNRYVHFSNLVKKEACYVIMDTELYEILTSTREFVENFKLKDLINDKYPVPKPILPKLPWIPPIPSKPVEPSKPIAPPPYPTKPTEPTQTKINLKELFTAVFLEKSFRNIKAKKAEFSLQKQRYAEQMQEWEAECRNINIKHMEFRGEEMDYVELHNAYIKEVQTQEDIEKCNKLITKIKDKYQLILATWKKDQKIYEEEAFDDKIKLANLIVQYECFDEEGVKNYFGLILKYAYAHSSLEDQHELYYNHNSKLLIIDFKLPDLLSLNIFGRGKKSFGKVSTPELNKAAEFILYALPIKTLFIIAHMDYKDSVESIVFNGWVSFTDKSTGHIRNEYILSIHVNKEQIKPLKIENVDPKSCFRSLKGISASKIAEYVPIPPILTFNKDDKRLIESKAIIKGLNNETNLAIMDWQDFEHLVRELFEKEFAQGDGVEVRVTQASRDKGVDAIVYDPRPLRGGKIVIQAKRYNSTVDVSAIRDLYGTVLNEGAMKGILVTTSYYGKDSYEFIKGKPLELIDGSGLLHLFKKHAYEFKIDLKSAKLQ